jgi:molybdenum cofactor cytidylyltransferase
MSNISAVILAAGTSSRMGETKQLMKLGDAYILEKVIHKCLSFPFTEIINIIGHDSEDITTNIQIHDPRFKWIVNKDFKAGMSTSFHSALLRIKKSSSFIVFLGDQPFIKESTIQSILNEGIVQMQSQQTPFVIQPSYQGRRSHPIFFGFHQEIDFSSIKDDRGARDVIKQLKTRIDIEVQDDPYLFFDIDTQADYEKAVAIAKDFH